MHTVYKPEKLPDAPGVYIFLCNDLEHPLYIGKSINLRKRVLSHYYEIKHSTKKEKMLKKVDCIKYMRTAGDLGASLEESRLIKKLNPIYNKRLRRTKKIYYICINRNSRTKIFTVKIESESSHSFRPGNEKIGLFRSKKYADNFLTRICDEHNLCYDSIMGAKLNARCFRQQLRKCAGVCCGLMSISKHNYELTSALEQHKQETWPYSGIIKINEQSMGINSCYLIDNWRHISTESDGQLTAANNDTEFNRDEYMILRRFITQEKHKHQIRVY